jgi:hypothetical protein
MADIPVSALRKYWTQKLALMKSECYAITNKHPEATFVAQVYKVLSDIWNLAGCTATKVGESSEWTSIMMLSITLYGIYAVTLNELKAVLKVSAQATA